MTEETGEPRARDYFFQRLLMAKVGLARRRDTLYIDLIDYSIFSPDGY